MMKRRKFWLGLLAGALAVNLAVGMRVYSVEAEASGEREAFEKTRVMMRVLHLLQKDYVDASKVDYTQLIYGALRGMVSSLDPFSAFMTPDEYHDMMESTEGEFGGLGIIVTVRDEVLTIISPIEGTPGSKAGLLAGDQIVRINGNSTRDLKLADTVKLLKGEPGTSVAITVHRPSTGETKDMTIERALIPVVNVKDDCMLDDSSTNLPPTGSKPH
jgi:carboxyl-terminal processing protease